MLRGYKPDPTHVIAYKPITIKEDMTYEERPTQILDWRELLLTNKTISYVKVLWQHHTPEEAT